MITPTSATPRDLVGLAERMGIPTEDAVHHVLQHLTDQQLDAAVVAVGQRRRPASNGVAFVA